MRHKVVRLLEDVREAGTAIQTFTATATEASYSGNPMMRRAVEREFEIIGEALRRLQVEDDQLAARISALQRIVDFRNVLAHGYDTVDDRRVWQIVQQNLPGLLREVGDILEQVSE